MAKKRWAELSAGQKMVVVVGATLQVSLLATALWDLAHRTADEVRGDRRVWAGLVFINWIGPLAYFTVGRKCGPCRTPCHASTSDGTESEPSAV
ncbi:MAG: PLDc N-terminal domain-containing protein [bacterium]